MARYDAQSAPASGGGYGGLALAGAGAGGAAAALTLDRARMVASDAKIGKWAAIGVGAVYALGGNAAQNNANTAMTAINGTAGSTYSTDSPAIKSAIQNLAQAVGNLNPLGYLGLSAQTQPLATPSAAAPTTTNNSGLALVAGIALIAVLSK